MPESRVKGNRESFTMDSAATSYTANDLNQYADIDPPTTSQEYLCHDADGNLLQDAKATSGCGTNDGLFKYTWDMENRLIAVEPVSESNGDKKAEYRYDYKGRRVRKIVSTYNAGWSETSDEIFLYDEWNVILVLDANNSNAILRKYIWGLDLSGQSGSFSASGIHGAGGVGGLLAVDDTDDYWYLYDANGNVGQLVKNTTGYPVTALYEYDPYGKRIAAVDIDSSGYADDNPFRFSTKWLDHELAKAGQTGAIGEDGMYYYGY